MLDKYCILNMLSSENKDIIIIISIIIILFLWLYSPVCVGPGRKPRRQGF